MATETAKAKVQDESQRSQDGLEYEIQAGTQAEHNDFVETSKEAILSHPKHAATQAKIIRFKGSKAEEKKGTAPVLPCLTPAH
jgi:hypothetical protein